jgi:lysophospholipase L1-like esterase
MAQIDHILVYGQSLAVAYSPVGGDGIGGGGPQAARPALTTVALDPTNVLMLNAGARVPQNANGSAVLNGATITSLTGLKEQTNSGGYSETICSGLAYWLKPRISSKVLVTAHGISGASLDQLSHGTNPYNNLKTIVTRAKALALAAGHTYTVRAIALIQCEGNETTIKAPLWAGQVEQLRLDLNTDLGAIVGTALDLPVFFHQASSFWKGRWVSNDIEDVFALPMMPQAQLAVHLANPKVRLVTPTYLLDHVPGDDLHLIPDGYREMGERFGRAIYEHVYQGQVWDCLRPVSAVRDDNNIDITFNNTVPLTSDTTKTAEDGYLGLAVTVEGAAASLARARISGDNTVRLVLRTPARQGETTVWGGFPQWDANRVSGPDGGPRLNLRESVADPSLFGYPDLYKWCAHFQMVAS